MDYKVVKTFTLNACGEEFTVGDRVILRYNNRVTIGRIKRIDDDFLGIEGLDKNYFYAVYHISIIKKINHYYPGIEKNF